jgi:hypothetical protein
MQHYRLYFLDDGNHIVSVLDLHCENEEQARERAWQLVDNQVVELWQEERFIGRFGVPSKPH